MFDRSTAMTDKFPANRKKQSMRTFSTSQRITSGGRLTLILSLCEGGLKFILLNKRGKV